MHFTILYFLPHLHKLEQRKKKEKKRKNNLRYYYYFIDALKSLVYGL